MEGGILKIANTIVTDSGTFRCSAQNPIGFVHADIQIFVQGMIPLLINHPKLLFFALAGADVVTLLAAAWS